jgi:hypothetical protein
MRQRRLGRTEVHVSVICLGTMTWGQQNTEEEAHQRERHGPAGRLRLLRLERNARFLHRRGVNFDNPQIVVNARLLDDFDVDRIEAHVIDGKNFW